MASGTARAPAASGTDRPTPRLVGWWLLGLVALGLTALAVSAFQIYTPVFHTVPVVDWLDATPLMNQAEGVPPARTLAEGFNAVAPDMVAGGITPYRPDIGHPGIFVRGISGTRDGASILKVTPRDATHQDQATLRLSVAVFHRAQRAEAWADLRAIQLDLGPPPVKYLRARQDGDATWVGAPPAEGVSDLDRQQRQAIVVGVRGVVAFEVVATLHRPEFDESVDGVDLSARVETLARSTSQQWTDWLATQRAAQDW